MSEKYSVVVRNSGELSKDLIHQDEVIFGTGTVVVSVEPTSVQSGNEVPLFSRAVKKYTSIGMPTDRSYDYPTGESFPIPFFNLRKGLAKMRAQALANRLNRDNTSNMSADSYKFGFPNAHVLVGDMNGSIVDTGREQTSEERKKHRGDLRKSSAAFMVGAVVFWEASKELNSNVGSKTLKGLSIASLGKAIFDASRIGISRLTEPAKI